MPSQGSKRACHVISNTHWDREWRYPFQAYRMDLVDMMDRLLDTLERRDDYRAFFLDSQTVILEDYLEIRAENEDRIRALVKADRLQIGPWHTLPDMWCCPGEALVRNLLMGHRVARRLGGVSKIGYTPFSNGQISQLPQLYQGFGIDAVMFYRGVGKHVAKSEFLWEGADGTRILGFRFGDYARYNYYYLLYRPGLLGRTPKDRDFDWSPEEGPYRVAIDQSQDRQWSWMRPRLGVHEDKLETAINEARDFTAADATTSQLLYMMGHDHSWAVEEEADLIAALAKHPAAGEDEIFHSTFAKYLKAFRAEAKGLQVLTGEMRHANKIGLWTNLFALILSCRLYLKQRNAQVCTKIMGIAEPLAAAAWATGSAYPGRYLELAWNDILINQAHDAIGGCSVDPVHEQMWTRWQEIETIADEIARRSMRDVASRIDASALGDDALQLTVFNTVPRTRSEVAEFVIDVPTKDEGAIFAVETMDGQPVPMQVHSRTPYMASVEGGHELPMPLYVQRFRASLLLENLPSLGHEALAVRPGKAPRTLEGSIVQSARTLENEHLRVEVERNGTLTLTDRRTGRAMSGLGLFEDTAEFGDPWNRVVPENDAAMLSERVSASVSIHRSGALEGALRIDIALKVPAAKIEGKSERAEERVAIPVTMIASLKKNSPRLDLTVTLENTAKDHRLRMLFPSGIAEATHSTAEGQFDVLERPIETPSGEGWKEAPYATHPMWNWVDVSDGESGFAVINDGLTEYEVIDDHARTVTITLLRTFGKFYFERPTPGSQCLGGHTYRFSILPHVGRWSDAALFHHTQCHVTPIQALQSAPTQGTRPAREGLLTLSNPALVVSGIKQSEDGERIVVRIWNPTSEPQPLTVQFGVPITSAERLTLEEVTVESLDVKDSAVTLTVGPKKIETVAGPIP